jgi:PadR family transcriptional regulator AphA
MDGLTTTSYAILGQLALRPWTTYALTAEMRRNLRFFWPRAESAIYAEVKRLAERGLALAELEPVGRRHRTVYAITPAGQQALEDWLATPPKGAVLEFEALLRIFFARNGTREQLLAALEAAQTQAEALLTVGEAIGREYREGRAPFREQADVRAFVFDFLASYGRTIQRWAERTRAEVAAWDDLPPERRAERALQIIDDALER